MDRFLADAASILDTGLNVLAAGQVPSDLIILTGVKGQNHLLAECDWALDAIRIQRGAECAYRITSRFGTVIVEGDKQGRTCRLQQAPIQSLTASGHRLSSVPGP
jgi:hypothetical protein